tara:strand:+ start:1773 stop:2210 length:438 start_codon:yes stop_codon:yes gene_type:complete
MARRNKELSAEVSLIAFISLLSVLICSLLLTAIWTRMGTMDIKQAMGGPGKVSEKKPDPVLWAYFGKNDTIRFKMENSRVKMQQHQASMADMETLRSVIGALVAEEKSLSTVLIKPQNKTVYEKVILLMDEFKGYGIKNLGIVPL